MEHALAVMIRQSGGTADLERPIPSMSQRREDGSIREAILDVQIMFPGVLRVWNVDVSVRSAVSERYGCKKLDPQHALRLACKEKHDRYGPSVVPIVFGTLGRVSTETDLELRSLAVACSTADRTGGSARPETVARAWRERLQRTIIWAQAAVLALALGSQRVQT